MHIKRRIFYENNENQLSFPYIFVSLHTIMCAQRMVMTKKNEPTKKSQRKKHTTQRNIDVVCNDFWGHKMKKSKKKNMKTKQVETKEGRLEVYTLKKAFQYTSMLCDQPCPNISLGIYELTNCGVGCMWFNVK